MIKYTSFQDLNLDSIENKIDMTKWEFLKTVDPDYIDLDKILDFKKRFDSSIFDTVVIIGIGGSMLGAQTIYHTLQEKIDPTINVHFVNNIDPFDISTTIEKLDISKTLFITITKSGNTPETMTNYFLFKNILSSKKLDISKHFVYVCNKGENNLRLEAQKTGGEVFDIPVDLGGRYSVISNVGLLFAAILGLDINQMILGARVMKEKFEDEINNNEASFMAKSLFDAYTENDQKIFCLFPYFNRGQYFAKWYIQLFAESLGKKLDNGGNISFTPIYAIGATDQHSILQLFKEGGNDKYYIFMELLDHGKYQLDIPSIDNEKLSFLSDLEYEFVLNTQMQATIDSLRESQRSVSKLAIPELSEESLGYMFMYFELVCAVLGDLFGVNTFNQPGVERSKVLTKEYLTERR